MPGGPARDAVHVQVLGGFALAVGGVVVPEQAWPSRRAAELVQLLAISPGHRLLRDQVVDALWPHLDAAAGAANLRKAAHHARRAVGPPDAVVLRVGHVALFPDRDVTTDLERFEQAAAAALARGGAAASAAAADLYAGELLPGARYEPWAEGPRLRAERRHVELLRAGHQWERLVAADPGDEAAYVHLMRDALEAGLRPAAIRWYGRARAGLAELGVTPGEELEALYATATAGLAPVAPALVGRDGELAEAGAALHAIAAGHLDALVVRGPVGIGKTALCHELAERAEAAGCAVHRLSAIGGDDPLGPVTRLVDELLLGSRALLGTLGPHAHAVLADLTAVAGPAAALDGPISRHQVMGALHQLLRACSRGRPTLVVLDDAHLAGDATVDVLVHLATSTPDVAVVLVLRDAAGGTGLARGVARLQRAGRTTTVDLGPLDDAASRSLVGAAAPSLAPGVVERVVELGEGNPFALAELARSAAADVARGATITPTLAGAVLSRLVELPPGGVDALQRLAVVGEEVDGTSAAALVAGAGGGGADEVLDAALAAGALVVTGTRYRFTHDLVRQALLEQLPPHRRHALHRDAAERLAAVGAPPAAVASQWLAAGRPGDASGWLLAAARQAVHVGAFADARAAARAVLAHDAGHPEARRIDAEALDLLGDPAALAAYDAAIEVADAADVDDLRAMRALAQVKQGDPRGGVLAVTGVVPRTVAGRLAEALAWAGAAALGAVDPGTGTRKAAECRRLALESGDRAAIVIASWAQAAAAHARGELRDSVLADLRDTKDLPHLAVRVFDGHLCITQRFLYGARPYDDVIVFAEGIAAEARRLGAARGHAFGVNLRGEAELLSGRLDAASEHLAHAVDLHRATAGAVGEAHALQRLAEVALHRGEHDRARALIDEALDLARVTDIGFHLLDRIYGTRITMARDAAEALAAVDEAEAAVAGPLETCPGCRITFAVPAAIACARAGALERSVAYAQASEYLAHVVMRLPAWDAAHEEVLANLAVARGDEEEARGRFAAAAVGFARAGQPLDQQRCAALLAAR